MKITAVHKIKPYELTTCFPNHKYTCFSTIYTLEIVLITLSLGEYVFVAPEYASNVEFYTVDTDV